MKPETYVSALEQSALKRTNILDLLDYRISAMECLSTPQPLCGAHSAGLTDIP